MDGTFFLKKKTMLLFGGMEIHFRGSSDEYEASHKFPMVRSIISHL